MIGQLLMRMRCWLTTDACLKIRMLMWNRRGQWYDGDDDDDDEDEEEEPAEIEQKDAALLPSPSLRKKRKRQPKASVRSSRRRKQT